MERIRFRGGRRNTRSPSWPPKWSAVYIVPFLVNFLEQTFGEDDFLGRLAVGQIDCR